VKAVSDFILLNVFLCSSTRPLLQHCCDLPHAIYLIP